MRRPAPLSEVALRGLHGARWFLAALPTLCSCPRLHTDTFSLIYPPLFCHQSCLRRGSCLCRSSNITQCGLIGRVRIGRLFLNLLILSGALVAALLFWFWLLPRFLSSFPIGVNLPGGVQLGTYQFIQAEPTSLSLRSERLGCCWSA